MKITSGSFMFRSLCGLIVGGLLLGSEEAQAVPRRIHVTEENKAEFVVMGMGYACYRAPFSAPKLGQLSADDLKPGVVWKHIPKAIRKSLRRLDTLSAQSAAGVRALRRAERLVAQTCGNGMTVADMQTLLQDCEGAQSRRLWRHRWPTPVPTAWVITPTPSVTVTIPGGAPTMVPTSTPGGGVTATPEPTATPIMQVPTPTGMPMPMPTPADTTNYPKGMPGISSERFTTEGPPRSSNSRDTFRTRVGFTHFLKDDPIVYPGQPGASHLHMFFGNALVDAFTTKDNIRTKCMSAAAGGTANCSGYWIPAIYDGAANLVRPDFSLWYYKAGYQVSTRNQVVPPVGLMMKVGSMSGSPTNPQPSGNGASDTEVKGIRYSWNCHDDYRLATPYIPTDCSAGSVLTLDIEFPACWDGVNLDSKDHISHMRYGDGQGACPASHPVSIPDITLTMEFKVPAAGTRGWKLSSDMYSVDDNHPGGYSTHADWIMGWDRDVMQKFVTNCNNSEMDCVVDNLGDGTGLDNSPSIVGNMYR